MGTLASRAQFGGYICVVFLLCFYKTLQIVGISFRGSPELEIVQETHMESIPDATSYAKLVGFCRSCRNIHPLKTHVPNGK